MANFLLFRVSELLQFIYTFSLVFLRSKTYQNRGGGEKVLNNYLTHLLPGSIRNTESMIKYLFFISQGVI